VGHYFIQDPTSSIEVGSATTKAVSTIGISTTQATVNGTLAYRYQYEQGGNTRWILGIKITSTTTVQVLAKAETLTTTDIYRISNTSTTVPTTITVVVDSTTLPYTVLSVQ